jgi:hypothetical protein
MSWLAVRVQSADDTLPGLALHNHVLQGLIQVVVSAKSCKKRGDICKGSGNLDIIFGLLSTEAMQY